MEKLRKSNKVTEAINIGGNLVNYISKEVSSKIILEYATCLLER